MNNTLAQNQIDRFWSRVNKTDGCWIWAGPPNSNGYGQVSLNKRVYRAHRLAYELTFGPIPRGKFLCHTCDNRLCVNPSHLRLGTHEDNIQDMVSRRRAGPGRNAARGERAGCSKLTEPQVMQIVHTYQQGGVSQSELAWRYGVTVATVSRILRGIAWQHLTKDVLR